MEKKLYRITEGRKLAGVCGGIAEYFNIDATLIRLACALFTLFAFAGVWIYIICAIVIPEKPNAIDTNASDFETVE